MTEYEGSTTALIADVDCTAGGEDLCQEVGVEGYPTIKYGDPNDLQDYEGGRDLDDLQTFAKENLGPQCGPANMDLCDEAKVEKINKLMATPQADLEASVAEKTAEMKKIDADFNEFVEGLQKQYEDAQKKKDDDVKELKNSDLGIMKSVLAHLKAKKEEL
jgi:hypothetical protein